MRDGFQLVARIPYGFPPVYLTIASEVATMRFLRSSGIPVPEIYGYSAGPDNAAKTEYIFMEYVRGTSLSDVWATLGPDETGQIVRQIDELESKMTALSFPAGGSIYYLRDLEGLVAGDKPVPLEDGPFCVGPGVDPCLWHGRRVQLDVHRGPCTLPFSPQHMLRLSSFLVLVDTNGEEMLVAPARKELAYLKQFGMPLLPRFRMRRKGYRYQEQHPSDHAANLHNFLRMVPSLVREADFGRFCVRHPDIRSTNVFVEKSTGSGSESGSWRIVSLIDWERTVILPELLQESVSRDLHAFVPYSSSNPPWGPNTIPSLPKNLNTLTEREQESAEGVYRRQFVNHLYVQSGYPWVAESLDMKVALIEAAENWERLATRRDGGVHAAPVPPCPVTFDPQDVSDTRKLMKVQSRADRLIWLFGASSRIRAGGAVAKGHYRKARRDCREALKDEMEEADTDEERANIEAHWPYHDHSEDGYR